MSTSVLLRSDIDQNVRILLDSTEEKVGDLLGHRLSFLYGENLIKALPIDALRIVAEGVNSYKNKDNAFLIITHYQRLLDYIKPDFVHVLMNGKIIKSGGPELALELEKKGYENFN